MQLLPSLDITDGAKIMKFFVSLSDGPLFQLDVVLLSCMSEIYLRKILSSPQ